MFSGVGGSKKASGAVLIPIVFGTRLVRMASYVIEGQLPLLMSINSLKRIHGKINAATPSLECVFGTFPLVPTANGLLALDLTNEPMGAESTLSTAYQTDFPVYKGTAVPGTPVPSTTTGVPAGVYCDECDGSTRAVAKYQCQGICYRGSRRVPCNKYLCDFHVDPTHAHCERCVANTMTKSPTRPVSKDTDKEQGFRSLTANVRWLQ